MKFYTTSKISENIHETPEGFLVCIGVPIARTGEMVYGEGETPLEVGDDGRILIDREADEVFRPETIASFEGKAVTITHPTDFVSPDNWSRLAKGLLQNVRRGEGDQADDLIADLLITDSVAINLVKSGLREVSCGYEAEYIQMGEGRGLQKNIVGNHLALVDEGRAGSAYAINDHKGKGTRLMSIKAKIKAIMGKAQDEALALVTDEAAKEDKKDDASKEKEKEKSKDAPAASYDDLVKMVKDLGAKIEGMAPKPKQKDASTEATASEPAKVDAKDEEAGAEETAAAAGVEGRLSAIEARLDAIEEGQAEKESGEEATDEDGEEDGDADESEDDDFEESTMTGDSASRMEILAPGLKANGKDAKAKALKAAYATKDGKKAIDALTGGKAPVLDSADKVNTLFIAASEILKSSRTSELARTKAVRDAAGEPSPSGAKSAEEMNAINAKHYANR